MFPYSFSCAAPGSSLTRRVGLCPTPCWGSAPDPARALPLTREGSAPDFSELARKNCPARATAPWTAELASRLGLPLCSAPPHHYLFSCTPLLAAELGAGARPCRFAFGFTALFGPAASLSFFLHSATCGGVGCRGTPLPLCAFPRKPLFTCPQAWAPGSPNLRGRPLQCG